MAIKWVTSSFRRLTNIRTTWLLVLLAAVAAAFWQCSGDKPVAFVPPVEIISFIDSVFPADGAIDVPLGSCVQITFLRQMDTATMTPNKFHFDIDNIYSLSIDTLKAVMCAARGLDRATEYHVVIDSGIADTAGNVMTTPYSFSFRTESGDAFIAAISPTNGQTDVPLDAAIEVTFNQGMNIATLIPSNIVVSNGVTGNLAYANRRLVFTPGDSLESNHTYTVTLKAAIADSTGVTLGQDYSWTFTTIKVGNGYIQSVFPVDGATEVPIDANPYIQFSVAIDPASLTPGDFTVSGGVAGDVSIVGTYKSSVVFNPTADLQYGTSYTAAFHGDLISTEGQTIHINHTWSFTTADTLPPYVVSVFPPDGAVGIPPHIDPSITFNKAVDPASITDGEFYLEGHTNGRDETRVSGATITLKAYYSLPTLHQVTAVFNGDVSDKNGHSVHIDTTWTFTTGPAFNLSSRYPAPDEGCILLDAIIRVTYTHNLDSTTVNSMNFVYEEYNGPKLSGSLSCRDSVIEFRPDAPFSPLKTYKVTVLTGIKEIYGEYMFNSTSWLFSARGDNLLPLAIGNKWIYQVGGGLDSIAIVRDTVISGKHYYIDHRNRRYRYEDNVLQTSFQNLGVYDPPYSFSCSDGSCSRSTTVTTDIGTYLCQPFHKSGPGVLDNHSYNVLQEYDFAPGVGMIRLYEYGEPYSSDYWPTSITWELISYELH